MSSALYKSVSLFCCKERIRCNCVTFGDNKMLLHASPVVQQRFHVWEVILHVSKSIQLCPLRLESIYIFMLQLICGIPSPICMGSFKRRQNPLRAVI